MSHIERLAERVRSLALAAGNLDAMLGHAIPHIRDLALQVSQMAQFAEDPYPLRRAAESLEAAARTVESACRYSAETRQRGHAYAAMLASGGSAGGSSLPLAESDVDARSTPNRINLADDVPDVALTPDFGGYLDVVMHGDANGTQADVNGTRADFTLDEVVAMVTRNADWGHRAIRLMSCSTGQAGYAQDLADRLGVPVYAPSDVLSVAGGVKEVLNDGSWRRFEPRL